MYTQFIKIFDTRKVIVSEALDAISTLFIECPKLLEETIGSFTTYYLGAIQNHDDVYVLKSGLICNGALCDTLGQSLYKYDNGNLCNLVVGNLLRHLQNPEVDQTLRPLIITSFVDIALALGPLYINYVTHTMNVLSAASDIPIDSDETNEDYIDYVIALRESILEAYPAIIACLAETNEQKQFIPHLRKIIPFMQSLWNETEYRTRTILSNMVGVIGDIFKEVVPLMDKQDVNSLCSMPFINQMLAHGINKSVNPDTRQYAMWAKQLYDRERKRAQS